MNGHEFERRVRRLGRRQGVAVSFDPRIWKAEEMAFGFPYTLEPEENGWWLVRFPDVPEALTEGETREEAHSNAADCLLAALEGYVKAGRPIPRPSSTVGNGHRVTLPSLATAKLAVYETMRSRGWSMTRLAEELNISKDAARRLISLRQASPMAIIDKALAAMGAELAIELP